MRISISNIAWDIAEDELVASLLSQFNINAIDIAPGKYFPEPALATDDEILKVKHWWQDKGIQIIGMQSLLFGTIGLNIFGDLYVQNRLKQHLLAICRIAEGVGATRLVFGSPKNRDRTGLTDEQAQEQAVEFFQSIGNMASSFGLNICLEPNPTCYGSNFMINSDQTATIVKLVDHPAIKMQFDTGALIINEEDPLAIIYKYNELIGHVHISEPNLVTLGNGLVDHSEISAAINKYLPNHIATIEMIASESGTHLESINKALTHVVKHYRI